MKNLLKKRELLSSLIKGSFLLVVFFIFTFCNKTNITQIIGPEIISPELTISTASLSFAASGGERTFTITSNTSWTVNRGAASWLTVTPSSGSINGTITVTATAHTDVTERTATITVTAGGLSRTINVTQDGASPSPTLTVSTKELSFAASGGERTFTISSNTSWTVSRGSASWLTVTPSSGSINETITVTATAHTDVTERTATITVTAGNLTQTVQVKQDEGAPPATLKVSESSLSFTSGSESKEFIISSNTSWTISRGAASWLAINPSSGSKDATISVTSSVNTSTSERTAIISVTGGGITQDIHVTQAGAAPTPNLQISVTSLSFTAPHESKTFTITSNLNWTVRSDESWLTVAPASGSNYGTITVTAAENTDFTLRTATITVSGGDITRNIEVKQYSKVSWTMSPSVLNLPASAGQQTFTLTAYGISWLLEAGNQNWLTVSPVIGGSGNNTITVAVTANNTTVQRSARIYLYVNWGSGSTYTYEYVTVTQSGER